MHLFSRRVSRTMACAMSQFLPSLRDPTPFCALGTSSRLLVFTLEETQIRSHAPDAEYLAFGIGERVRGGGLVTPVSHLWAAGKGINALVPHTIPFLFSGFVSHITTKLFVCHPQSVSLPTPPLLNRLYICRQMLISQASQHPSVD